MQGILIRGATLAALACAILASSPSPARALPADIAAVRIFGQPDATTSTCLDNRTASTLCEPWGMVWDPTTDSLYISDTDNSRVLRYASPLTTDLVADTVLGQPGMTLGACNLFDVPSASTLCFPGGIAVDSAGNLYVADSGNSRVLEYDSPATTDTVADRVYGQSDMTTTGVGTTSGDGGVCEPDSVAIDAAGALYASDTCYGRILVHDNPLVDSVADGVIGQPTLDDTACVIAADRLCSPTGLAFDASGNLYVTESFNNRVLVYLGLEDTTADRVIGQADMTSVSCNRGVVSPSASTLCAPQGLAVDSSGSLYVADSGNQRVLVYENPLNNGTAAGVYGQGGDFTTRSINKAGLSAGSLRFPRDVTLDADGHLFIADSDNDRAVQYDPCVSATDCDGDGALDADDNCSWIANAAQTNTDSDPIPLAPSPSDSTRPRTDSLGDACDSDDDADGRSDADEASGENCGGTPRVTNPILDDTDGDRVVDGAECTLGSDPTNTLSKPALGPAGDSDFDGVSDNVEIRGYNTAPDDQDSDDDGCPDDIEIASVDSNTVVNAIDLNQIAQRFFMTDKPVHDLDKNGTVNSLDLLLAAQNFMLTPCES